MLTIESRFLVLVCLGVGAAPGVVLALPPSPAGSEFQVNSYTTQVQTFPSVAVAGDGGFVVAWQSAEQDGSNYGVFARRFDSGGSAQGVEFQVNSYTTERQYDPAVGVASNGAFVVAWRSYGQDGSDAGVFAQRFDAAGSAQGGELQVNSYTMDDQTRPSVGVASDGAFVVAWRSYGQDGSSYGVFAQRFDSGGSAQGVEFQVNSYTTAGQYDLAIGVASDGDFVVAWQSNTQDGSGYGVFAQRFEAPTAILDIDGNGSVGPLTDGLLVLRYLFGFTGATLVSGAFDTVACTRCDAPSIEAYLATLI